MSEYRNQLKTFGYKNNPFKKDGKNFTRAFNKFVRENPRTPLPKNKIFNPITKRIVLKSSVLDSRYKDKEVLKPKLSTKGSTYLGKKTKGKGLFLDKDGFISDYLIKTKRELIKVYLTEDYKTEIDINKLPNRDIKDFLKITRANAPILLKTEASYNNPAVYYTLNNITNKRLFKGEGTHTANYANSDAEFQQSVSVNTKFTVSNVRKPKAEEGKVKYKNHTAAFFPYIIKDDILKLDLNRYGVFHEIKKGNYNQNCLIKALKQSKEIDEKTLTKLIHKVRTQHIPKKTLKEIAEKGKFHITLKIDGDKTNTYHFGDKTKPEIKLAIVADHYFIREDTKYTSYGIKNYKELVKTNPKDWYLFIAKGRRSKGHGIDSYSLIKLLVEHKDTFLEPIEICNELFTTQLSNKIDEFPKKLFIDEEETKPVVDIEKDTKFRDYKDTLRERTEKIYFDFETDVYTKGGLHIPYLCWCVWWCDILNDWDGESFIGERCGLDMLKFLHNKYLGKVGDDGEKINIKMIAHNCGYDFRVGIFKHLAAVKTIEKGKSLMCGDGKFYNFSKEFIQFSFTDSYALIPVGLKKFSKMFGLNAKKEILPYRLYTTENIQKGLIPVEKCLKFVKQKDRKEYLKNCEDWDCYEIGLNGEDILVDIIKYSSIYCRMDCITLAQGYDKFNKIIGGLTQGKIDIDDYISLASIADAYLKVNGCYNDCYQIGGVCRSFIQECLVGGRTMLADNCKFTTNKNHSRKNRQKNQTKKGKRVADKDAVSLYSSSMVRLAGYLKGKPKVIEDHLLNKIINKENIKDDKIKNYKKWIKADGYYIEAVVKKIGVKRHFPLLSKVNDDGIREFRNDLVGETIFIDNIALEDSVKFQDVEVEIIKGYYFNSGFNTKVGETIQGLFEARLKAKKEKNEGLQQTIKLIMNSSYGKTALKEINEDVKYIHNGAYDDFVYKNYNFIKDITPQANEQGYRIKLVKPINEHFNRVHIGIQVLSMSKRIMNEVMCLAEDNNIQMFYQDTDSIHLYYNDVKILDDLFFKKYGKELDGKNLGQFHIDFDLGSGQFKDNGDEIGCENIYSESFIGLGKKSYIDCLVGTCPITGKEIRGNHIRMKGVPNGAILYYCRENNITPEELYFRLLDGDDVEFDLLKDLDGDKIGFEYRKDMTIHTAKEFKREVCFRTETAKERKERRKERDSKILNQIA